jgi:predicted amidohydrolase
MRIAVAQTPGTRLDQWRETRVLLEDMVAGAAGRAAELVVLPECAWPAYCLGTRQAYWDARGAGLPGPDEFLDRICHAARDRQIAICAGFVAEEGDALWNAAVLIGPDGRILGTRYKCFRWAFDRDYFEAGVQIEPIAAPFGRAGVMICADARLPEIPATLAARGAELILHPTAWVNAGSTEAPWNPQPDFLIPARAAEFGVPVASASKWGAEGDTTFVGSSLVCDAEGRVVAQCGPAETTVIAADIEPRPPRRPQATDSERCLLLSRQPPSPPRAAVARLELLLRPPGRGVALARAAGSDTWQPVRPGEPAEIGGARIGVLSGAHVRSFAPARCLALEGTHVVVVYGGAPAGLLRTRACENRVFVIAIGDDGWSAIDPRGMVIHERHWLVGGAQDMGITLEAAQAASKTVAPGTDVIAGRQPASYVFTRE